MKRWAKSLAGKAILSARLLRRLMGDHGAVIGFHRVDDRYGGDSLTCGEADFVSYCRMFRTHFDVISLTALVSLLEKGESVAGKLVVTFDDGYLDNYSTAAPIMWELDLTATFFLTSGFIGSTTIPWWDAEQGIKTEFMDWTHVAELHKMGFDIGAHTRTHPNLGLLGGEEARREIQGSKEEIEDRLGAGVDLFAYPYGGPDHMSEENRALVRDLGFRCCPSSYGGRVSRGDDPFYLKRVPISGWFRSPSHFAIELLTG